MRRAGLVPSWGMRPVGERIVLAAFLAGAVLAGGNGVAIRFSNRELEPLWGASLRFALAGGLMLAATAFLRRSLPRGRALVGTLLYGGLTFGAAFALAYYALVRVHAGLGQVLLGLVPLATLLLASLQRQERFHRAGAFGAILAVAGFAVMSQEPLREGVPLVSLLAAVGSALCFAQGALVVRRFPPAQPLATNAVAMSAGAALLLAGSVVAGERPELPQEPETWAALAYLVAVGSVVVFALYLFVLRHWSAGRTAYQFAVIPVVTVALSAWLDAEPVTSGLVIGGLLVLGGVYVGAFRLPPAERRREAGPGRRRIRARRSAARGAPGGGA